MAGTELRLFIRCKKTARCVELGCSLMAAAQPGQDIGTGNDGDL
jgi:hypothetical protein